MKKLVMTAAVLATAASVVTAQTVTSANMVGYTKVNAIKGQLTLVALNFEPSTNLVALLIGDQLPTGSFLHIWKKDTGAYLSVTKATRGGWGTTATINMGDAFWIQVPATAPLVTNTVILSGEVLQAATNTLAIGGPIDATGYYYPVDTLWGDTDLSVQLPNGSFLHVWNGTGYDSYTKATRGGWGAGATVNIGAAQGFWVQSAAPLNWSESRPFTP